MGFRDVGVWKFSFRVGLGFRLPGVQLDIREGSLSTGQLFAHP